MEPPSMRSGDVDANGIRGTMRTHLTIVASLHIAFAAIGVLTMLLAFLMVAATGMAMHQFPEAIFGTFIVGLALMFFVVMALPGVIGGIGLLVRKEWARILLIIVSFVQLINIPFGTALGVYSLWVLLQDDARRALIAA